MLDAHERSGPAFIQSGRGQGFEPLSEDRPRRTAGAGRASRWSKGRGWLFRLKSPASQQNGATDDEPQKQRVLE